MRKGGEKGFTLIEIIVSFSVIAILGTIGIASFSAYSKDQEFRNSYLEFVTNVNLARSRSLSQVMPANCSSLSLPLLGYQITIPDSRTYRVAAMCGSIAPGSPYAEKTFTFPSSVSFSDSLDINSTIFFPILKSEVFTNNIQIEITSTNRSTKTITIDRLGGVSVD